MGLLGTAIELRGESEGQGSHLFSTNERPASGPKFSRRRLAAHVTNMEHDHGKFLSHSQL
jgi:hypothetical protein